jgi:hypothetical protein
MLGAIDGPNLAPAGRRIAPFPAKVPKPVTHQSPQAIRANAAVRLLHWLEQSERRTYSGV